VARRVGRVVLPDALPAAGETQGQRVGSMVDPPKTKRPRPNTSAGVAGWERERGGLRPPAPPRSWSG
jgi:hypothetical protein